MTIYVFHNHWIVFIIAYFVKTVRRGALINISRSVIQKIFCKNLNIEEKLHRAVKYSNLHPVFSGKP